MGAGREEALVLPLGAHPVNMGNFFRDEQVLEGVVLLFVGLELEVIVVLLGGVDGFLVLEDDESARFVPHRKHPSRLVETNASHVILFQQFLAPATVPEQLRTAVPACYLRLLAHTSNQ